MIKMKGTKQSKRNKISVGDRLKTIIEQDMLGFESTEEAQLDIGLHVKTSPEANNLVDEHESVDETLINFFKVPMHLEKVC